MSETTAVAMQPSTPSSNGSPHNPQTLNHPPNQQPSASQPSPTKSSSAWWKALRPAGINSNSGEEPTGLFAKRPALGRSAISSHAVPGFGNSMRHSGGRTPDGVPMEYADSPIFGAPLDVSLEYAGVRISLTDPDGENFVYGIVPAIIAKCAVFLKQNARDTEGIFRIPGSVRRIRMLQDLFSTPPSFGKNLDWTGFTVHDAANLLKRYFALLPQPVIPRDSYEKFREPLQKQFIQIKSIKSNKAEPKAMSPPKAGSPITADQQPMANEGLSSVNETPIPGDSHRSEEKPSKPLDTNDSPISEADQKLLNAAISHYEALILSLPKSSGKLLLYLIDLLSVFASEYEVNRMTAYNLAAIFQPSVLTVPEHDMNPDESEISREVLQFLIENSGTLLERVQKHAIEHHKAEKQRQSNVLHSSNATTQGSVGDDQMPTAASHSVSSKYLGPSQLPSSAGLPTSIPELFVSSSGGSAIPGQAVHVRRHSKSVSSAQQPSLSLQEPPPLPQKETMPHKEEQPKFPGFLRRQRSTRSHRSGSGSRSPSEEADIANDDGERKSRFRRSLMILLPNRNGSRSPSPVR